MVKKFPKKNLNTTIQKMEEKEKSVVQKFLFELNNILTDHEERLQKLETVKEKQT